MVKNIIMIESPVMEEILTANRREDDNVYFWVKLMIENIKNTSTRRLKSKYDGYMLFTLYMELAAEAIPERGFIILSQINLEESTNPWKELAIRIEESLENTERALEVLTNPDIGLAKVYLVKEGENTYRYIIEMPFVSTNCHTGSKEYDRKKLKKERDKKLLAEKLEAELVGVNETESLSVYGTFKNVILNEEQIKILDATCGKEKIKGIIETVGLYKINNNYIPSEYKDDFEFCLAEAEKL